MTNEDKANMDNWPDEVTDLMPNLLKLEACDTWDPVVDFF